LCTSEAQSSDTQTEEVVTIQAGDVAPFAGTLFSTAAAAKLIVDLEFSEEACNIEIERQLSLSAAEYDLQIDTLNSTLESLQFRHDSLMEIRADHINYLESELRPDSWFESNEFVLLVGIVTGVGITIGSGYALNQVSQ